MLDTSEERVKLLKAGLFGKEIEKLYIKQNNFKIVYTPILYDLAEALKWKRAEDQNALFVMELSSRNRKEGLYRILINPIMHIKPAESDKEKSELDHLLWEVLWKPLDLPRNIRQSFKLDRPQIELVAIDNDAVIGGLVANWLSDKEIEIRHLAVSSDYQGRSVGRKLVENLMKMIETNAPVKIQTFARNMAAGFYAKMGFTPTNEYLELPGFAKHGITLQKMYFEKK